MTLALIRRFMWVSTLAFVVPWPGSAQADDDATIAYEIELQDDARMPGGRAAFLEGEADADGTRFFVPGTELMQPISVGAYTRTPSESLRLEVLKDDWSKPIRDVVTENGRADVHFRTYDGFRLRVSADQPTDYQLVVWVGNEQTPRLPPVTVPASAYVEPAAAPTAAGAAAGSATDGGNASSPLLLILIGVAAVLLIGGGAYLLGRRGKGGAL